MKTRYRKGQIVKGNSCIVLVTAAEGCKEALYRTFSGVVVKSLDNTDYITGWPVGTYSDSWSRTSFKPLKKHYVNVTTKKAVKGKSESER